MERSSWLPLFEGEAARQAYRTIAAISEALHTLAVEQRGGPSVAGGRAGAALLCAYLARALPGRGYEDAAVAEMDAAMNAVATTDLGPDLYGGFPGIGWAVEHLRGTVPDINGETNEGIDNGILIWLDGGPWNQDYDLVSGLVGLGVYAVERLPHPGGVACLERVVDRLAETAQEQPDGITWWTRPELLALDSRQRYPAGWYNLGLAHGIPGVIALLGEAYAADVARDRVRPLLNGAVQWLLGRKQSESAGSVFPTCLRPCLTDAPEASRSAWCYGDPGVAAALLLAARRVGEPYWEAEALEIARKAARRSPEESGVRDAGICHGAAGLGHIFNRFFHVTGEPLFRDAARFWLGRTIQMRLPGQGLAGYLVWGAKPGQGIELGMDMAWIEDPGLLTGVTGIALALLAAVSPVEPRWDRLLLTNV